MMISFGVAGATVLGTTGVTTTVSAEEVTPTQPTVETQASAVSTTVTEADVKSAETQLATTQANLASATRTENEARTSVTNAETAVAEAKAEVARVEEVAKTATPESIETAKQDVTAKETAVSKAETAVSTANTAKEQATVAEQNQATEVAKASAVSSEKETAVAKAQEALKTAEDVARGTNLEVAKQAQADAVAEEANAKTAVTVAKENVQRAELEAKNQAQVVQTARTAVSDAQAQVNSASNEVAQLRKDLERASADHNTALANLNRAQESAKVQNQNRITLPADFIEAVKDYVRLNADTNTTSAQLQQATDKILTLNAKIQDPTLNKYVPTATVTDATPSYDLNNLPREVQEDLALFATSLINQMREQLGFPTDVVTSSSLDFADKVAKNYVRDGFGRQETIQKGHNAKGINDVAREYGFVTSPQSAEDRGVQYYENAYATTGVYVRYDGEEVLLTTLEGLKVFTYQSVLRLVGTLQDAHVMSVLGLYDLANRSTVPPKRYLGADFSSVNGLNKFHLITGLTEERVASNSAFSTTAIANPYEGGQSAQALQEARNRVGQTKAVKDGVETKLNTAVSTQATAQAVLRSAERNLEEVSAGTDRVTPAKEALARAEVRYNTAVSTLATANATVSALTASVEEREQAVVKAKEALQKVQAELNLAKSNQVTETAKLNVLKAQTAEAEVAVSTAEKALETARKELASAKDRLDILANAPKRLADANTRLSLLTNDLEMAKQALTRAVSELEDAKAQHEVAESHHAKVVEAYTAYMKAKAEVERQEKLKADYDRLVNRGIKPVPVMNERGEVVAYEAPKATSQKAPAVAAVQKEVSQYAKQNLPKTGSQDTGALLALGLSLSALGLSGLKRKD